VLGRALRETSAAVPFSLVSLDGGKSRNAIPRDAVAVCSVAVGREEAFRAAIEVAAETIRDAFGRTDPGVAIRLSPADASLEPWTSADTDRLLDGVALVPTGPLALSRDFDGLVETRARSVRRSRTAAG
jgi:dipeptidase D